MQVLACSEEGVETFQRMNYEVNEEYRNCVRKVSWITSVHKEWAITGGQHREGFEDTVALLIEKGWVSKLSGWSCTFVNGVFVPSLSEIPSEGLLLSVGEAKRFYYQFFQLHKDSLENPQSPLHFLNTSFLDKAAFLYFPEELAVDEPIVIRNIVYKASGDRDTIFLPSITVAVSSKASINLRVAPAELFSEEPLVSTDIVHGVINIVAEDTSATALHICDHDVSNSYICSQENIPTSMSWSISALIQEESSITTYFHAKSQGFSKGIIDCRYQLLGTHAYAEFVGAVKNPKDLLLKVSMIHRSPETGSRQTIRSLLSEGSSFSFEGDIVIDAHCEESLAYQKHDSLLMDDACSVVTIPRLRIFTDNVKASHGATVGKPDERILFFMRSRGIPEEQAKQLFLEGFMQPCAEGSYFS